MYINLLLKMHRIPDYTGVLFLVGVYRTHYLHTL
nr:MAG TPA: GLUTATHIONE S-TRANSFERASE, GLUTATHIONE [Bacteriophage sp.]